MRSPTAVIASSPEFVDQLLGRVGPLARDVNDRNPGALQGEENGDGLADAEQLHARGHAGTADERPLSQQSSPVVDAAAPLLCGDRLRFGSLLSVTIAIVDDPSSWSPR